MRISDWSSDVCSSDLGGVWDYALELARGLSGLRISTVLAVMGGRRSAAQRAASEAVPGLIVEEGDFRLDWMRDADADLVERSEERRVGKECVRTFRSRWSPFH